MMRSHFDHPFPMRYALQENSKEVVFLKDGTPLLPAVLFKKYPDFYLENPPYVSGYYPSVGELSRYDIAQALGMALGDARLWRQRHPTFPKPCRTYRPAVEETHRQWRSKKSNITYSYWSVDEVLEWIEANLDESLTRKG
jgi:hypothetical protein